jgi:hypothetical protein
VGDRRSFSVTNLNTETYFQAPATLRAQSPTFSLWIADQIAFDQAAALQTLDDLEARVVPCVTALVLPGWRSSLGGARVSILLGNIPGVAGYYSSADEYPRSVVQNSNERTMFYLNSGAVRLGSPQLAGTLAHEFQHMAHWVADRAEQTWVNEGLSELAADLCGGSAGFAAAYLGNPNTQLTSWGATPSASGPHYGAAFLFMKYVHARFGTDAIRAIAADRSSGADGVDRALRRLGHPGFDDVFADWLVAGVVNAPSGPYGYAGYQAKARETATLGAGERSDAVRQFGARIYPLAVEGDATVSFAGRPSTPIIAAAPPEGARFWWSGRADNANPRLTREADLTGVRAATLRFKVWHDLERKWDFGYLSASTDGGATWRTLAATGTTTENPLGANFGSGWTGRADWQDAMVDLTPFAGRKVLLRFEVVTDDAISGEGLAIDALAIPEIGWSDGAEDDRGGWTAEGFSRLAPNRPQSYLVLAVAPGGTSVQRMQVDADGRGTLRLAGVRPGTVLIVSATLPVTTQDASFTLRVEQR